MKHPGGRRDSNRMARPGSLVLWALWPECWWSPDNRRWGRDAIYKEDEACTGPLKESQHSRSLPTPKGKRKKKYPLVRNQAGPPCPQPVSRRRHSHLKTWETWAFAVLSVQTSALFISWYGTWNQEIHTRTQRGTHRSKDNIALKHMFQHPERAHPTAIKHFSKLYCRWAKTKRKTSGKELRG